MTPEERYWGIFSLNLKRLLKRAEAWKTNRTWRSGKFHEKFSIVSFRVALCSVQDMVALALWLSCFYSFWRFTSTFMIEETGDDLIKKLLGIAVSYHQLTYISSLFVNCFPVCADTMTSVYTSGMKLRFISNENGYNFVIFYFYKLIQGTL